MVKCPLYFASLWFLHGHDRFRTASVQARVRIDQPGSIFPPVVDERSLAVVSECSTRRFPTFSLAGTLLYYFVE